MLRSLKGLENYKVSATDGDIGYVVNFLLDDELWTVRYLVVQTSGSFFLYGRQVLISPISFRQAEWSTQRFRLALTKDKVKNSPDVNVDKPISRQHERRYFRYFGYPNYWEYSNLRGMYFNPAELGEGRRRKLPAEKSDQAVDVDVHLRGAKEIRGFRIQGSDGVIGHVEDFIVDDETWQVRYLVIETRNWWFEKKVLVAPQWKSRVSWAEGKVDVEMSRQAIKDSPEWDAKVAINREYEARLHDYYGRPVYWGSPMPNQLPEHDPPSRAAGSRIEE